VKDRKPWNDLVLKTSNPCNIVLEEEEEEKEKEKEKKSLWLTYALSYWLNTLKHNIIY
jgi:hypothetical protein